MRTKTKHKHLIVTKDVYDRLLKDRKHFQDVISGGKWSLSDTICEYQKIIDTMTKEAQ